MAKRLTICVDIRDLRIAKTGARTYLAEISDVFRSDNDPRFKFIFLDSFFPYIYTGKNPFLKLIEQGRFFFWKQIELPIKAFLHQADIVFCTDFFVPRIQLGYTTVPVFHDAFFWEYPEHYNRYWRWLFIKLGVTAAKRSACIITPTIYTQKRIAHFSGIKEEKIIPVYEASKSFTFNPIPPERWQFLSQKRYILHVGTFEKRKNLTTLLKAFEQLRALPQNKDVALVLVGQMSPKKTLDGMDELQQLMEKETLSPHIHCTGYIADESLGFFYQHATVYAFPSLNEGFGIPILESFLYKVPVVIANNTCLPEVAGDAALSFSPLKDDELADALDKLLNNKSLRSELIEKGDKRLTLFSWKKTADTIKEIFLQHKI